MPRRAAAQIRPVEPAPVPGSRLVQQVINKVMLDGKKSTAERIVYDALAIMSERTGREPVEALENSIKTLTPVLEVRSRRVGGATYQVPVEVPARRARTLAVRRLLGFGPPPPRETEGPPPARGGGPAPPPRPGGVPVPRGFPPPAPREDDGPAPGERADGRDEPAGRRVQAQGRHLPHGAGQQGLRALPLVAGASPDPARLARRRCRACLPHRVPEGWAMPFGCVRVRHRCRTRLP